MKRILFVHHGSGEGGAPNSLSFLLKNLDFAKYDPVISCGYKEHKAKDFFEKEGFSPIDIPIARYMHFYHQYWSFFKLKDIFSMIKWIRNYNISRKAFKTALREINPDIVHLNSLSIIPLAFVAKRLGFPVVLHVREAAIKLNSLDLIWYWWNWLAKNYCDKIIYICKDNQEKLTGPIRTSLVIYNPIPFDKFDRNIDNLRIKEKLKIPNDKFVIFFPGGSDLVIKGIYPFLEAIANYRKKNKSFLVLLPMNKGNTFIEKRIINLDLQNTILKVPFIRNVESYYAVSDIVVSLHIVPHFSRAVIESGAMAKPIIASRIDGIKEVLIDSKNGILVEPGNERDIERAIEFLYSNKTVRDELSEFGFQFAKEKYNSIRYTHKVMDLYEKI